MRIIDSSFTSLIDSLNFLSIYVFYSAYSYKFLFLELIDSIPLMHESSLLPSYNEIASFGYLIYFCKKFL